MCLFLVWDTAAWPWLRQFCDSFLIVSSGTWYWHLPTATQQSCQSHDRFLLSSPLLFVPTLLISGTCRGQEKADNLARLGIRTYLFNPDETDAGWFDVQPLHNTSCAFVLSLCISHHGSLFHYVLCLSVFPLSYSGLDSDGQQALLTASHIVSTIPPAADFDRDAVLTHHYQLIASMEENKLSLSSSSSSSSLSTTSSSFSTSDTTIVWLGYLSTTGVYGNHDGAWVTEGR